LGSSSGRSGASTRLLSPSTMAFVCPTTTTATPASAGLDARRTTTALHSRHNLYCNAINHPQLYPTTTTTIRHGVMLMNDEFISPSIALPPVQQQQRQWHSRPRRCRSLMMMKMMMLISNKVDVGYRSVTGLVPSTTLCTTSIGPSMDIQRPRRGTNKRQRSEMWWNRKGSNTALQSTKRNQDNNKHDDHYSNDEDDDEDIEEEESDEAFLKRELTRLESLEDLLDEIENYCLIEDMCDDDNVDDDGDDDNDYDDNDDFNGVGGPDDDDIDELFSLLQETDSIGIDQLVDEDNDDEDDNEDDDDRCIPDLASFGLEQALLQGVVPANAQVGGDTLPGDWGFDPLHLAEKDYIHQAQYQLLSILPGGNPMKDPPPRPRPSALVLRDYREAEIRHGRLAMLAATFWPLQEKLDKLVLQDDQFGPLIYGPITLPYFPLIMTLLMMLLGYLDIYAKAIKEEEGIGDAFLPGDCFWDPLRVLEGAPPSMKRNMQERELFNGRVAMVAFAAFVFEEATSHQALVDITSNELLFVPAYQISFIQDWLDGQFGTYYHH
jgi:light-harvesting complex I chlorophyll a/b binding protein 1